MPTVLAIDTATDACSAALFHDGETLERYEVAPRRHTDLILPMVASLLADAALAANAIDVVAFGAGPGSFTGVRIATSVAQGIALAHELPVVPVSCLALLAIGGARALGADTVVAVMDARRQEIYAGAYRVDIRAALATPLSEDWIGSAEQLTFPTTANTVIVGRGATVYADVIDRHRPATARRADEPAFPRACDALATGLASLDHGTAIAPELAQPIYLRHAL